MILAGGRGERMAAGRNKALLSLAGRPMLLYSVDIFRPLCGRLVVVTGGVDLLEVKRLAPGIQVVEGGATRHDSERNALQALRAQLRADDVVAIHDAARPLVATADICTVFTTAEEHGAAMLAAPCALPLLEVGDGEVRRAYSASELWRAQTPQAARAAWLLSAYDHAAEVGFNGTDTAAVLEQAGSSVRIVPASSANPKITVPADLLAAEGLLPAG